MSVMYSEGSLLTPSQPSNFNSLGLMALLKIFLLRFTRFCVKSFSISQDGRAISLIPDDTLLTTQQAAQVLNISRPYLYRLLNAGQIPFIQVGTHRKLLLADVVALRERRRDESRNALNAIATINQECDDYGDDYGETTRE